MSTRDDLVVRTSTFSLADADNLKVALQLQQTAGLAAKNEEAGKTGTKDG